jgi:hypothetical protein
MSTRALALIAISAMLILGAIGIAAQAPRPGDTLQLWEYRTEVTRVETRRDTGQTDGMLNARGQEGWELVALTRREIRVEDAMMTESVYTFKRPTRSVNR